jgi:hypothetical protein
MKIGMMTRWNMYSGQSSHAEPIGHAWLEMGHELKIFAPKGLDSYLLHRTDEPFVHRCFIQNVWGQREGKDYFFNPKPYLEEDYEIFLMEMAYLMPMPEMLGIFPQIRKKAKTVLVVHETGLPPDPDWYKFEWDAIVCFNERYKAFMSRAYPEKSIEIIPYPCHPPLNGDKREARMRLGLPLDKKIVFAYGFNIIQNHVELVPVMEKLSKDYPVLLLLLTHHDCTKAEPKPGFLMLRDEMPDNQKLYTYLHACDAYVNYVGGTEYKIQGVGVSSSVAACLGAGRPVLVPGYCNFFDLSGKEIIKYANPQELEQRLRDVFEGASYVKESLAAAEEYARKNSGSEIAKQFIELFNRVLDKSLHLASNSLPRAA